MDTLYKDGTAPAIFDVVQLKVKAHKPSYYQPENYVFDENYCWCKNGRSKIEEVLQRVEKKEIVFYDSERKIHKTTLLEMPNEN